MTYKVTLSFGDKKTMEVTNIVDHENVVDVCIAHGYVRVKTETETWAYATDSLVGSVTRPMEGTDETV